jgi:hypothetical protein
MRKLLLSLCITACVGVLHAQINPVQPPLPKQSYGFKSKIAPQSSLGNTTTFYYYSDGTRLGNGLTLGQPNVDHMPVTGEGQVILTWRGNNNQGFGVYSATPDNMVVLKPDSTYYFVMPNAFKSSTPPAENR